MGSVLVGSQVFIQKAKHFRKLYGGGWRQAGILAAGCLHALDHHFPRLGRDHELAVRLQDSLLALGVPLSKKVETNMVWVDLSHWEDVDAEKLSQFLAPRGIRCFGGHGAQEVRFVIHSQIPSEALAALVQSFQHFLKSLKSSQIT